jgi:hypothetical protein
VSNRDKGAHVHHPGGCFLRRGTGLSGLGPGGNATPGPDVLTLSNGVFNQGLVVTPSFNTPSAYSALATASLNFPVYKRLGFNLSALDDFLNDPTFGSKKNSFQFSAGITYALK